MLLKVKSSTGDLFKLHKKCFRDTILEQKLSKSMLKMFINHFAFHLICIISNCCCNSFLCVFILDRAVWRLRFQVRVWLSSWWSGSPQKVRQTGLFSFLIYTEEGAKAISSFSPPHWFMLMQIYTFTPVQGHHSLWTGSVIARPPVWSVSSGTS